MLKRIAAAAGVGVLLVTLGGGCANADSAPGAAASSATMTPGCVTLHEYRQVGPGTTRHEVREAFGTRGVVSARTNHELVKAYRGCANGPLSVVVHYALSQGPLNMTHKRLLYRSAGVS